MGDQHALSGSSTKKTQVFLEQAQVDLPVIIAPRSKNPMFQDYKIYSFPRYCYIDERGNVLSTEVISLDV